ncbi:MULTISPECIES: hypothetical protein [Brevibacillus]|uniref:DUF3918 domain-containing protein n=2 Tax=Brevibacillus TaxID=55080 RepID=A0A075QZ77_BRELA|nr:MULTISPECIES: hypothetical protein [Brevibacillus]AIG25647.1 hypothetical protein BRLA_c013070 [Brevibacillus laterosporus LMG 15441]MBA4531141.1 hypothetical protein [Brevibacillus halotolerans]MCR8965077.1 hypothetical protein [Brevibacillus laterosporus]MCR8986381.1 hypothetical protein [Brevibacillus laterosporus]MCR8993994.1 hypothetical protein [Brevibacillus laterosporus]
MRRGIFRTLIMSGIVAAIGYLMRSKRSQKFFSGWGKMKFSQRDIQRLGRFVKRSFAR